MVDTALEGVSVSRSLRKLGMRGSDTVELALDDVQVPHANLIGGTPGEGFAQLMWQLQYERLSGAAAGIGQADEILDETIRYARDRQTFGTPLGNHQAIAHKLADAATELEAARALLYDTVWKIQQGDYPVAEISMAKKFVAQVQNRVADTCLQVHGGFGYMHEAPVSRAWRDARLQRIGAGTDEIMNEVIAKRLGHLDMSPRKAEHNKSVDTWVSDPLARLLFVNGPPMPARNGDQPPIPFSSLDEMREVWLEVRERILASMGSSGQVPWAEREWGDGTGTD